MTQKKRNGPGSHAKNGVIDFMEALKKRRLEEVDKLLRPLATHLTAFAKNIQQIRVRRTVLGSELAHVMKELEKRGFPQMSIAKIRRKIRGADELFERAEQHQGSYDLALEAYGEVAQMIATLLESKAK